MKRAKGWKAVWKRLKRGRRFRRAARITGYLNHLERSIGRR